MNPDLTLTNGLTLEECIGLLLCPEDREYSQDEWKRLLDDIPLGSVFLGAKSPRGLIQAHSRRPVLVVHDFEHGVGANLPGGLEFPWMMALGASKNPDNARIVGRGIRREGRALGYHWTLSPVADIALNQENPVVNIRAAGSKPGDVASFARAWIEGVQEAGDFSACAKHFPGDGHDDRDQHLCTSVNGLSMAEWWDSYGMVWREVIKAGVLSIMPGHISLPAYENLSHDRRQALPATVNPRLLQDLLRGELDYSGVIISDAAPMIGLCSRTRAEDAVVDFVKAGGDVFLFADPRKDFQRLLQAVQCGRLSEERVRESAARVITLGRKVRLSEPEDKARWTPKERQSFELQSEEIADHSITLLSGAPWQALDLPVGAQVLTVTIKEAGLSNQNRELGFVDEALRQRGLVVEHLETPSHSKLFEIAPTVEAIFINFALVPHSRIGTMRLTGPLIVAFWRAFWLEHPNVIFTSFGTPTHLSELPHLPNFWCTYGHSPCQQRSAVRAWFGEIPILGELPMDLKI